MMEKNKALELLSANEQLLDNIGDIIDYGHVLSDPIYNLLDREWAKIDDDGLIYFSRGDEHTMYDYSPYQISSLGAKGEKFFCAESDGVFYALAHPEDENWDKTEILILDMSNKVEFDEEKIDW